MGAEAIGWASSLMLLVTITVQIRKQWRERSSQGVSKWLFVGETAASFGFTIYSVLLHNWVFVVTNALMLVASVAGFVITLHHRRTFGDAGVTAVARDHEPHRAHAQSRE